MGPMGSEQLRGKVRREMMIERREIFDIYIVP